MSDTPNSTQAPPTDDGSSDGSIPPEFVAQLARLLRSEYSSSLLSSVSYGLYFALAGMAVYLLRKNGRAYNARRITLIYTAVMFVVTSIWYITGARVSAFLFIDMQLPPPFNNNAPTCSAIPLLSKVSALVQFLLSDGAMLYRMYVTWNGDLRITILPALIYLASAAFGVLAELFCVHPQLNVMTAMFRQVFFITTVVFNGFVTLAIAYKIVRVMRDMGRYGHGNASVESRASAVALILTESAMVYTIVGIAVIFTFKSQDPSALVLGTAFQSLSFLSPALIILRVAMGVSIEKHLLTHSSHDSCSRSDIEKRSLAVSTPAFKSTLSPSPRSSTIIDISMHAMESNSDLTVDVSAAEMGNTSVKDGPWSARHRWSVKSPVKSLIASPIDQVATFR